MKFSFTWTMLAFRSIWRNSLNIPFKLLQSKLRVFYDCFVQKICQHVYSKIKHSTQSTINVWKWSKNRIWKPYLKTLLRFWFSKWDIFFVQTKWNLLSRLTTIDRFLIFTQTAQHSIIRWLRFIALLNDFAIHKPHNYICSLSICQQNILCEAKMKKKKKQKKKKKKVDH